MVLAAGYGTRLGELTDEDPKPMIEAGGRPILEWIIRHLAAHGASRVAINLHYRGARIRGHFGDGARFGLTELSYFEEPDLLGTAGGVRNALEFLGRDGPFIVNYGDVVTDANLREMADFHRERGGLATMLVHERPRSNSVAVVGGDGLVSRFLERPEERERAATGSPWVFSGICVLEPEALESLPPADPADLPRDLFPRLVAARALYAFPLAGFRVAVDSPERLEELRGAIASGECRIAAGR